MDKRAIGVLDSGVGGLTVWREILSLLPQESTIYIADSKNTPYGSKRADEIITLASRLIEFLLKKDVKLIVVACNTITVSGIDELRKKYSQVPIIGTVPVIKRAAELTKKGTIGVLSTTSTAQSEYQKSLIHTFAKGKKVINLGTDKIVPLVEKGESRSLEIQKILKEALTPFKKEGIDVLALGCTHFPFLEKSMQKILGKEVKLLHSGSAIARQVDKILEHNQQKSENKKFSHVLFTTGDKKILKKIIEDLGIRPDVVQSIKI